MESTGVVLPETTGLRKKPLTVFYCQRGGRSQALPRGTRQPCQSPGWTREEVSPWGGEALTRVGVRRCRTVQGGAEQPAPSPGSGYVTSRGPRAQNTSVMQLSTALVHVPQHFPCEGEDFWRYGTDLSVADRTQGLEVFQGALSSSTVNRLDMVYLPELAFCRVCYYFIQLQWTKDMTLETLDIPSDLHVRPTVRTRNNSEK